MTRIHHPAPKPQPKPDIKPLREDTAPVARQRCAQAPADLMSDAFTAASSAQARVVLDPSQLPAPMRPGQPLAPGQPEALDIARRLALAASGAQRSPGSVPSGLAGAITQLPVSDLMRAMWGAKQPAPAKPEPLPVKAPPLAARPKPLPVKPEPMPIPKEPVDPQPVQVQPLPLWVGPTPAQTEPAEPIREPAPILDLR